MAVDRTAFVAALEVYGTVEFCDVNNPNCYVVVVSNVTADLITMKSICDNYLLADYPNEEVMTLVDGLFKTEYDIIL